MVKNLPVNAADARHMALISGLGRFPGVGNGNPLHYSCLENSMERGAWLATVYGITKSRTQLSMQACMLRFPSLMAMPVGIILLLSCLCILNVYVYGVGEDNAERR